jgi:hypothetical protein
MAWCAAGCLAVAGCACVALAGWNDEYAVLLILAPLLIGIGPFVRLVHLRRMRSRAGYRSLAGHPFESQLLAALTRSGLRRLDVLAGTQVKGVARSIRAGRNGIIVVDELILASRGAGAFFLAHEAAHLARYDSLRRPVTDTCALVCVYFVGLGWPPAFLALGPLVVAAAWRNHAMELDCDRIATVWAGLDAAEQAMAWLAAIYRRRPATVARKLRRLLTYPEPARRLTGVRVAGNDSRQLLPRRGPRKGRSP